METSLVLITLVLSGFETIYAQENTTAEAIETTAELESVLLEADGADMGGMVDMNTDIKKLLMSFFNGSKSINFASDARINLNGEVVRSWFKYLIVHS